MRTITLHLPDDTPYLDDIGDTMTIDDHELARLAAGVLRDAWLRQQQKAELSGLTIITEADNIAAKAFRRDFPRSTRGERRRAADDADAIIREHQQPPHEGGPT